MSKLSKTRSLASCLICANESHFYPRRSSELRTPLHQIISTASLLRTELMEPLSSQAPPVNTVVVDLLNNLESANLKLERNVSSILSYFSSLAIDYTSNDAQVIADSLPSKTLGQLFEVTLPRLLLANRAMGQHEDNLSDVDVIVDFGKLIVSHVHTGALN